MGARVLLGISIFVLAISVVRLSLNQPTSQVAGINEVAVKEITGDNFDTINEAELLAEVSNQPHRWLDLRENKNEELPEIFVSQNQIQPTFAENGSLILPQNDDLKTILILNPNQEIGLDKYKVYIYYHI